MSLYFIEMGKKEQRKLILKAIKKAGTEKNLAKQTGIPESSIYHYRWGRKIPKPRVSSILKVLNFDEKIFFSGVKIISKKQWLSKGGKNSVLSKIKKGTFDDNINKMRKATTTRLTIWHKTMRTQQRKKYYTIQYERFKKVGEYKHKTLQGEMVRNELEKKVANSLFKNNIRYEYEPYLECGNRSYFPDFRLGKILIECTACSDFKNQYKLLKKIRDYEKIGYKPIVIIPENLMRCYKTISQYVIHNPEELIKTAPVAQIIVRLGK